MIFATFLDFFCHQNHHPMSARLLTFSLLHPCSGHIRMYSVSVYDKIDVWSNASQTSESGFSECVLVDVYTYF